MGPYERRSGRPVLKLDGSATIETVVIDQVPAFTARIHRPYALARFPVTNWLYARFLDDLRRRGEEQEWRERRPATWPGSSYRPGEGSHPITGVNWRDAMIFAA